MTTAKNYRVILNSFVKEFNGHSDSEIEGLIMKYPLLINCTISPAISSSSSSSSSSRLDCRSSRLRRKRVSIARTKARDEKYQSIWLFYELDEEISVY